jgi:hypothetical protein
MMKRTHVFAIASAARQAAFFLFGPRGLLGFRTDFPQARARLLYLGNRRWHDRGIEVLPFLDCVSQLDQWL